MAGFSAHAFVPGVTPEQVFDFATDPSTATLVAKNIKSLEPITPGPVTKGTRLREVRVVDGQEATAELEVREHERPARYVVGAAVSGIDVEYDFRYAAERGGTRIDLTCKVVGTGLKKLMAPVVAGIMKKEDGDHLDRLSEALVKRVGAGQ